MPRPPKLRTVRDLVPVRVFKPAGIPQRDLEEVVLTIDALEALRLADVEGFEHVAAAELMGVSRPTFSRLVAKARTTVATALIQGLALRIEGGPARAAEDDEITRCCGRGFRRRRGHCRNNAQDQPLCERAVADQTASSSSAGQKKKDAT